MANSVLNAPHFQDEEAAFAFVESHLWPEGPYCPFCGATSEHIGKLQGKTTRPGLRKCYACKKPFTVRIGSIFEGSHLALHLWLQVIHLMCASKKGISTRQIQRMLKCSMKTAWFLTHRIREVMAPGADAAPLGGAGKVVEADETYIGANALRDMDGACPNQRASPHPNPKLTLRNTTASSKPRKRLKRVKTRKSLSARSRRLFPRRGGPPPSYNVEVLQAVEHVHMNRGTASFHALHENRLFVD
jgi:transposase-like protein